MKKYIKGIIIGTMIGLIQSLFLLFAKDIAITVYISTLITWIIIGLLISSVDFKINRTVKGTFVALLVSAPSFVYTFSVTVLGTIWTLTTTVIMGALMGYFIEKKRDSNQ